MGYAAILFPPHFGVPDAVGVCRSRYVRQGIRLHHAGHPRVPGVWNQNGYINLAVLGSQMAV